MNKKIVRVACAIATGCLGACVAFAQAKAENPAVSSYRFAFSHTQGDMFRVISRVDEDVYINNRYAGSAEILNRIAMTVTQAAPDGSWGYLSGTVDTSERKKTDTVYVLSQTYHTEYRRDRLGRYQIDPKYLMPIVRNVPTFPDRELKPGDTWTAPGEERQDFSSLGIPDPYAFPVDVRYEFVGPVERGGKRLLLVKASYTVFLQPGPPRRHASIYPVQIAGFSNQSIYWDSSIGQPSAYEERFDFIFDWSDGRKDEFKGSAGSELVRTAAMDRGSVKKDIEDAVSGIPDITVRNDDSGITISIENIQFEADSAELKPSELAKIDRIAEILKRYPDRDVLVSGHAAAAGYAEGRLPLSEARAKAVAERLIALKARDTERIRAVGMGDTKPIADNTTESGRARNRRVEITILEN
jgi:outer membrane protein OmpA-like peptidoglycan-associated protein